MKTLYLKSQKHSTNYARFVGVAACLVASIGAAGAAFGWWSGTTTVTGFLLLALLLLLIGVRTNGYRRVSEVFALAAVIGLAGIGFLVANLTLATSLLGAVLGVISMVLVSGIAKKGWNHA